MNKTGLLAVSKMPQCKAITCHTWFRFAKSN